MRWIFFGSGQFIWIDQDDRVIGPARFPLESAVIGLDRDNIVYGCGSSSGKAPECMAYHPDSLDPLWHITLGEGEKVIGGSVAPGVLYIGTENGTLYALGD
ncbi:MAG: PQQ-binding-like beta-propeller repeat protein [Anaerolineae bacterium]|nr:PQQ-binding-like beta-propeller repeat protein [Anaerolineae bacterium]